MMSLKNLLKWLLDLERKQFNPKRAAKNKMYQEYRQFRRPVCRGELPKVSRCFMDYPNSKNLIF